MNLCRRLRGALSVLTALLGLALTDATVGPSAFPPPVVVIYPLTVTGATAADAGDNIALLLSSRIISLGGITVKPPPPGTVRALYLDAADKAGADYYVTGYLTPLGDEVSLIVQVVSTHSSTVIFSNTSMIRTYSDAAEQAEVLHDAILRHAGRSYANIDEPPAPASSPESVVGGGGVNLSRAFGHHAKPAAGASPAPDASAGPQAIAARPVAFATLVFSVAGSADDASRRYAAAAIAHALAHVGIVGGVLPVTADQALGHAAQLCAANGNSRELYAPTLTVASGATAGAATQVQLEVAAYDCAGALLGRQRALTSVGRRGVDDAIDKAAGEATAALPRPPAAGPS
jgi:hypothetical protein